MNEEHLYFIVPSLFKIEVLSGLSRRLTSSPQKNDLLTEVEISLHSEIFSAFEITESLIELASTLAKEIRLRAYDCIYVALAMQEDLPLITFDDEIREKTQNIIVSRTLKKKVRILDLQTNWQKPLKEIVEQ